ATTRASPSVPGATTSRATRSASMTTAPCPASRRATSLLPAPIPPVSPTLSTGPVNRTAAVRGATGAQTTCGDRAESPHRSESAAGELLLQRGEGLVGGQRAGRLLRRLPTLVPLALAGAVGTGAVPGLGRRPGRVDLPLVLLPPRAGLGVLPLPLLALLLVAGQPLPTVGVEPLRVLVVAVLVVLGGHPVQGRVEVLLVLDEALVRLLDRQRDPPALQVDVDDLDHDLVADLHHLLGDLHVLLGQLGDVHQALDAVLDPHERAERHQLGDHTGHDLLDLVLTGEL